MLTLILRLNQLAYAEINQINLIRPLIVMNKNNINKPIFYKNNKNTIQNEMYRKWLMETYLKFINTQFDGRLIKVQAIYKRFGDIKNNLKKLCLMMIVQQIL